MGSGESSRQRTYGGWQQEKVAFVFGLSAARAAMLAGAVLAAITPVAAADMPSAFVFWPAALVLAAAALVRVAGRTGDEWLAGAVSYALIRVRGQHRFVGGPFALPRAAVPAAVVAAGVPPALPAPAGTTDAGDSAGTPGLVLPGILAPLRLLSVPAGGGDLAVAVNRHDRTYTAVARVRFPGIGLADSVRRDQRVAGWGALLASLCTEGSPVIRVQALQRLVPETGAALRAWHEAHLTGDAPALAAATAAELLASSTLATSRREAYLAVTMDARRAAGAIRAAGGGDLGAAAVLVRCLRSVQQAAGGADLEIGEWLGARDLAEVIRTAFDPHSQPVLATRRAAASARPRGATAAPGVSPDLAGPVYAEARPGCYVHDGAVSASYWVHSWPRGQAFCTALGPLLADGSHRRSFGMIFEPLGPRRAERAVMRERTARHAAVRMRQRTGQLVPEDERAAAELAQVQDAERAAGHGLVRFAGYATVTADEAGIEDACAALEADAAAARIEVRRMWFAQDAGFAVGALPLGMGLPKRGW